MSKANKIEVTLKVSMSGPEVDLNVGDKILLNEAQVKQYADADYIEIDEAIVSVLEKGRKEVKLESDNDSSVNSAEKNVKTEKTLSKMNSGELVEKIEALKGISTADIKDAAKLGNKAKIKFIKNYKPKEQK